ncbi:hypothetical protein C8J56DRAFT_900943 [Mycena floridula]|nr:hypothetical protein C8J56DRAFT_900943 [Mycena floridula]
MATLPEFSQRLLLQTRSAIFASIQLTSHGANGPFPQAQFLAIPAVASRFPRVSCLPPALWMKKRTSKSYESHGHVGSFVGTAKLWTAASDSEVPGKIQRTYIEKNHFTLSVATSTKFIAACICIDMSASTSPNRHVPVGAWFREVGDFPPSHVSPKVREEYPPFAPLPSLASSGGPPNRGVSGGHAKDLFPLLPYTEGDRCKAFSKTGLISKKKSNPRIEPGTAGVKGRRTAARCLSDWAIRTHG